MSFKYDYIDFKALLKEFSSIQNSLEKVGTAALSFSTVSESCNMIFKKINVIFIHVIELPFELPCLLFFREYSNSLK